MKIYGWSHKHGSWGRHHDNCKDSVDILRGVSIKTPNDASLSVHDAQEIRHQCDKNVVQGYMKSKKRFLCNM